MCFFLHIQWQTTFVDSLFPTFIIINCVQKVNKKGENFEVFDIEEELKKLPGKPRCLYYA
mgnify:CR=1 FL=1